MTRKELVDLLVANYAEDDEVYVRYFDDQGECVDKVNGVEDVTETFCQGYYEVKVDGNWRKMENGECAIDFARDCVRYVQTGDYDVTRKCIVV